MMQKMLNQIPALRHASVLAQLTCRRKENHAAGPVAFVE